MTKQVQLSDQAYQVLASRKRPGESFSQTVLRLAEHAKDPWSFVGARRSGRSLEEHLRIADELRGPLL